ncbi:MAG TPA: transaldolase family protein [Bryobacteraceae bacterium]
MDSRRHNRILAQPAIRRFTSRHCANGAKTRELIGLAGEIKSGRLDLELFENLDNSEGININITLMFSMRHYEAVVSAYIRGLERCRRPEKVASVASFFVSRVDTKVTTSSWVCSGHPLM